MAGFRIASSLTPDPTPKAKPVKKASYLDFIRSLPCAVTGRYGVQAAHLSFAAPRYGHYGRGRGTKAGDRWALPLNPDAHSEQHKGNEELWWRMFNVNPHVLALTLFGLWSDLGDDAQPFAAAIINQQLQERLS
jgi:hypothetical protein